MPVASSWNVGLSAASHTTTAPPRLSSHRYRNKLSTCNLISSQPMSSDELPRAHPQRFRPLCCDISPRIARGVEYGQYVQVGRATWWSALVCPRAPHTHVSRGACICSIRRETHAVSYMEVLHDDIVLVECTKYALRLSSADIAFTVRLHRSTTAEPSRTAR